VATGQPQLIELDHNALWHALKKEAFHSSILEMELAARPARFCCATCSTTRTSQLVQHIDFQRVDAKTRLHMKVPLHYKGEEESRSRQDRTLPGEPRDHRADISCLPADLPEFIEVDLSGLKKGTPLHVKDIKLPKGVKFVSHGKPNPVLVSVVTPPPKKPKPLPKAPPTRLPTPSRSGRQGWQGPPQGPPPSPAAKK
jgi:large subunit ribosomal protein L25